jgi:hypothetical protein
VLTDHVVAVVAFAADGSALWSADSEVISGWVEARTITASAEPGSVHIAAHIRDPFTFGPHTTGEVGAQYAAFAELSGINTGIVPVRKPGGLDAWPVPARSIVQVHHEGNGTTATLHAATGEVLRTVRLVPGINTIDLNALPAGLYILRTGEGEAVRVVKE